MLGTLCWLSFGPWVAGRQEKNWKRRLEVVVVFRFQVGKAGDRMMVYKLERDRFTVFWR